MPAQTYLPRWRGFNLQNFFTIKSTGDVCEDDFRWMADWGFNFVRLPLCYTLWLDGDDPYRIYTPMLLKIDRAIELGRRYGMHVCLNFHRAPGYSVNNERDEPFNLWTDDEAIKAFCYHWQLFARRYQGIDPDELSFNLVNEPAAPSSRMTRAQHQYVITAATQAIRAEDSERLIIADGLSWGNDPCPELADLAVAQSCRAYLPMGVSHYQASWVNSDQYPPPAWPGGWQDGVSWTRSTLEDHFAKWAALAAQRVGVHCGEAGAYNKTPHDILLRWLRDVLEILTGYGIGYAMWNFHGPFGILNSGRSDVDYEEWHGQKLDRALLALLQEF